MAFDEYGYICHFNDACRCQVADCDYCGWNPEVSERRLEQFLHGNQDEEETTVKKVVDLNPIIKELADWCLVTKGLECSILGAVIDRLRAAPGVEAAQWIPVSERLPEPWKWVLCYCRAGIIEMLRYDHLMDEWGASTLSRVYMKDYVTHWMPLPEAPEVK